MKCPHAHVDLFSKVPQYFVFVFVHSMTRSEIFFRIIKNELIINGFFFSFSPVCAYSIDKKVIKKRYFYGIIKKNLLVKKDGIFPMNKTKVI